MLPDPAPRPSGTRGRTRSGGPGPIRRRAVLAGTGAALAAVSLAACGVRWDQVRLDDGTTPAPPRLGPDDLARFAAVASVQALRDLATAVADPAAEVVAERHRAHLDQLGPLPGPIPSPSATPSGWPTSTPTPSPTPSGAPGLVALAMAERDAAATLVASATAADARVEGPLALLLVAVGTSCRVTAVALGADVPATTPPADPDPSGLRAATGPLAALVEAHRAAAYGYGVLSVRLATPARDTAVAAIGSHGAEAAHLAELGVRAGVDVPPGQPAYVLDVPADAEAAARLALVLELDVAAAAGALVAAATGRWRELAAAHLGEVALAARAWGEVPAFPGVPEQG